MQSQGWVLQKDVPSQLCSPSYVPWRGLCLPEGRTPFSNSHETAAGAQSVVGQGTGGWRTEDGNR